MVYTVKTVVMLLGHLQEKIIVTTVLSNYDGIDVMNGVVQVYSPDFCVV